MNTLAKPVHPGVTATRPWYAHIWPWLLMLGPMAVIVAGGFTGWVAFTRQDALVVDDYYKQGKAINQDLRRDRAATNLGLKSGIRYDAAKDSLMGNVTANDKPWVGKVIVRLVHSTLPEKDVVLSAQTASDGSFVMALPMLDVAHWQVQVENEGREWRLTGGWNWPQQTSVALKADDPPAE